MSDGDTIFRRFLPSPARYFVRENLKKVVSLKRKCHEVDLTFFEFARSLAARLASVQNKSGLIGIISAIAAGFTQNNQRPVWTRYRPSDRESF